MSQYMKIVVVEGRQLASSKKIYVSVSVLNSNGQRVGKDVRTSSVRGTNCPTWGIPFQFTVDDEFAGIVVRVHEKGAILDKFLGIATIRLTNEREKYKKSTKWYELSKQSPSQVVSGDIRLEIDFCDPTLGPDARKTRSKMTSKDRSLSVSITHSPAELPDEIIVRSSTNPVAGEGERIPVIPSKSPRKSLQSPHSSNVDDRKKLRASVALTNFHSTLGDDHTVIGAFSVSQQGNKRKSMQPGDIDRGYLSSGPVSSRVRHENSAASPDSTSQLRKPDSIPLSEGTKTIVDPKAPPSGARKKVKRATSLDHTADKKITSPAMKAFPSMSLAASQKTSTSATNSPVAKRVKSSAATASPASSTKPKPRSKNSSGGLDYSTDSPVRMRTAPALTTRTPIESPSASPSKKRKFARGKPTATDVDNTTDNNSTPTLPVGRANVESPTRLRNASPSKVTRQKSPSKSTDDQAAPGIALENTSPSKRGSIGPFVVGRKGSYDKSAKSLSLHVGYATDGPSIARKSVDKKKVLTKAAESPDNAGAASRRNALLAAALADDSDSMDKAPRNDTPPHSPVLSVRKQRQHSPPRKLVAPQSETESSSSAPPTPEPVRKKKPVKKKSKHLPALTSPTTAKSSIETSISSDPEPISGELVPPQQDRLATKEKTAVSPPAESVEPSHASSVVAEESIYLKEEDGSISSSYSSSAASLPAVEELSLTAPEGDSVAPEPVPAHVVIPMVGHAPEMPITISEDMDVHAIVEPPSPVPPVIEAIEPLPEPESDLKVELATAEVDTKEESFTSTDTSMEPTAPVAHEPDIYIVPIPVATNATSPSSTQSSPRMSESPRASRPISSPTPEPGTPESSSPTTPRAHSGRAKIDRTSSQVEADSERRVKLASEAGHARSGAVNGLISSPQTAETKSVLLKSFFAGLGVAKHK